MYLYQTPAVKLGKELRQITPQAGLFDIVFSHQRTKNGADIFTFRYQTPDTGPHFIQTKVPPVLEVQKDYLALPSPIC